MYLTGQWAGIWTVWQSGVVVMGEYFKVRLEAQLADLTGSIMMLRLITASSNVAHEGSNIGLP